MTTPADIERMIAQVALRDQSAFSALYDATSRKLFGVCLHILNNRSEAEEVLQEVYIRIWNKANSYAVTGHSPMTWLITIARNMAIDQLRKRKAPAREIETIFDLADDRPGPEAEAIRSSERDKITACLNELDAKHSDAVRRVYLKGETYKDLAQSHDVPFEYDADLAAAQFAKAKGLFDTMTSPFDQEDDILAAEYVLRLLGAEERKDFEIRMRDQAQLRDLVHQWEARLAPIANDVEGITPPDYIKSAILARIAPQPVKSSKVRGWMIGVMGLAAAAAIAVVTLGPNFLNPIDMSPQFEARLASSDGEIVLVAGVIPPTHEIVINPIEGASEPGRVWELWLIAEGASAPVSLGLLNQEGTTRIRVPDEIAPGVRTGTIAISDEPLGGSPTGAPTGDILATATFEDI